MKNLLILIFLSPGFLYSQDKVDVSYQNQNNYIKKDPVEREQQYIKNKISKEETQKNDLIYFCYLNKIY